MLAEALALEGLNTLSYDKKCSHIHKPGLSINSKLVQSIVDFINNEN